MTRIFLLLIVALMFAPAAFAQDYSHFEFYVGYAHERANNGADSFDNNGRATFNGRPVDLRSRRVDYNGFETEFNQNITHNIGIVASFSGTYHTTNFVDNNSGRTFRARVQRYDLLAGPRFNLRTGRLTPFAHALFGVSYMRARFNDALANCPSSFSGNQDQVAFSFFDFSGALHRRDEARHFPLAKCKIMVLSAVLIREVS